MTIKLTEQERNALVRALDAYLELLTAEAARTEVREAEHDLWSFKEQLEALRTRISSAGPFDLENERPGAH